MGCETFWLYAAAQCYSKQCAHICRMVPACIPQLHTHALLTETQAYHSAVLSRWSPCVLAGSDISDRRPTRKCQCRALSRLWFCHCLLEKNKHAAFRRKDTERRKKHSMSRLLIRHQVAFFVQNTREIAVLNPKTCCLSNHTDTHTLPNSLQSRVKQPWVEIALEWQVAYMHSVLACTTTEVTGGCVLPSCRYCTNIKLRKIVILFLKPQMHMHTFTLTSTFVDFFFFFLHDMLQLDNIAVHWDLYKSHCFISCSIIEWRSSKNACAELEAPGDLCSSAVR